MGAGHLFGAIKFSQQGASMSQAQQFEFKTEIKQEWLFVEQTPICPNLDYCPF